jgi:beta-lactamase regulating signal transducer with metallopeptidase domain/Leucine-rich repeat (LRR) protein
MRFDIVETLVSLPPVAECILRITALLAVGWMAHLAARGRNPRWRVLLWRAVAVAVVVLPGLGLVLPELKVAVRTTPDAGKPTAAIPASTASQGPWLMGAHPGGWVPPETGFVPAAEAPEASAAPSPTSSSGEWLRAHWRSLLPGTWALLAAVLAAGAARADARLRRIVRESRSAPVSANRLLRKVAADLQCRADVALRCSAEVPSPILAGLLRPVIVLPEDLPKASSGGDLRAILAHELRHLQSGDLLWARILQTLSILLWFHPLMWRVRTAHAAACEEVCDAAAADYVGDPAAYGGTLARVALAVVNQVQLRGGIPMARTSEIRVRLERLRAKLWASPLRRRSVLISLLAGGLALAGLGSVKLVAAGPTEGASVAGEGSLPAAPAAAARGASVPAASGSRILRFPKDRCVGSLAIQDENAQRQIEACSYWVDGLQWEAIGPALGDVAIPPGKRVQLTVSDEGARDMSFLAALGPDDLYGLGFGGLSALGASFASADAGLKHAAHLTGVRVLGLRLAPITATGLAHLSKMKSLERIYMPMRADNSTLRPLRAFPNLKAVYLESPQITDAGLLQLAGLANLEELELATDRLTGAGLRNLARLRGLRYLFLHGQVSGEALTQLQAPPSLRILCVNVKPFGDVGMEAISRITQLERFSAHWAEDITDRGVGYLTRMPNLKKLDLGSARITDEAARVLGQIRTLDYLTLPTLGLTDAGLEHVANLENLRFLSVACFTGSPLTDQTLARLAKLPKLEELTIAGAFTDEGMKSLGGMGAMKALCLTFAPLMDPHVTNAGIAHLGRLTKLQRLALANQKQCTLSGLSALKDLKDLRILHVLDIRQDQKGMDLSGLTHLEDLLISMYGQRVGQEMAWDPMIDDDLRTLANLPNLRRIQLPHRGFTDRGLQYLSGLKNAEFINLGGEGITDAGFAAFSNLPRLNWLKISGGAVTDAALTHLEALPSLERLEIQSDQPISQKAVKALRAKLPQLDSVRVGQ